MPRCSTKSTSPPGGRQGVEGCSVATELPRTAVSSRHTVCTEAEADRQQAAWTWEAGGHLFPSGIPGPTKLAAIGQSGNTRTARHWAKTRPSQTRPRCVVWSGIAVNLMAERYQSLPGCEAARRHRSIDPSSLCSVSPASRSPIPADPGPRHTPTLAVPPLLRLWSGDTPHLELES